MRIMIRALAAAALAMSQMGGCLSSNLNDAEVVVPFTARVSVASAGTEANADGVDPAISADGRYVVFESYATNLVSTPTTTGEWHIYRRDTSSGKTELVDIGMNGAAAQPYGSNGAAISADGRHVYFYSFATNLTARPFAASGSHNLAYRRDMNDPDPATRIECVSVSLTNGEPDGSCFDLSVSADNRFVVFESDARNLVAVPAVPLNGGIHVYRRDLTLSTGHTAVVSINKDGQLPSTGTIWPVLSKAGRISGDGRFVAFASNAIDLAASPAAEVGSDQIYRRDMTLSTNGTVMVSVTPLGSPFKQWYGKPVYDEGGAISANGEVIAFSAIASELTPNAYRGDGVFLRNIPAGTTTLVSLAGSGTKGNGPSCVFFLGAYDYFLAPALSADGTRVVFWSDASNLVDGDTNNARDIFMRDTVAGTTVRINVVTGGGQTIPATIPYLYSYAISADGTFVAFDSASGDLVTGDTNGVTDVFLRGPLR